WRPAPDLTLSRTEFSSWEAALTRSRTLTPRPPPNRSCAVARPVVSSLPWGHREIPQARSLIARSAKILARYQLLLVPGCFLGLPPSLSQRARDPGASKILWSS